MFTLAGIIGMIITVLAWTSRSYRRLSAAQVELAQGS
jgi:hypothetical protein